MISEVGGRDVVKLIQFAGRLISQLDNNNRHTGEHMAVTHANPLMIQRSIDLSELVWEQFLVYFCSKLFCFLVTLKV